MTLDFYTGSCTLRHCMVTGDIDVILTQSWPKALKIHYLVVCKNELDFHCVHITFITNTTNTTC